MRLRLFLIAASIIMSVSCNSQNITKIELKLSAFGVESDRYPNIEAAIDFEKGTSLCKVSYYHPDYKPFQYTLTQKEVAKVLNLLENTDLKKLKEDYTVNVSDQLTSTLKIYTTDKTYIIKDYGLKGDAPLTELYKIIYKFDKTVK